VTLISFDAVTKGATDADTDKNTEILDVNRRLEAVL